MVEHDDDVVILSAVRTPIGKFQGSLSSVPASRLGAIVIAESLRRAGADGLDVSEVLMGNVIQAGEGQAPARQASLGAGLPPQTGAVTINKVCGSSLKTLCWRRRSCGPAPRRPLRGRRHGERGPGAVSSPAVRLSARARRGGGCRDP
jgi:hypothetical protein